jgi:hypothetical protein
LPSILRPSLWDFATFASENVWNDHCDLDLLQPIEIPQNGQNILWKSLALEPHFFGIAWQKFGALGML